MVCNKYSLPATSKMIIAFAGGPSSGKDTMADLCRVALTNPSHKVYEFAREYMQSHGPLYSNLQQNIIYEEQVKLEESAMKTYPIVFSSSPRFLAFIYALILMSDKPPSAEYANLANLFEKATRSVVAGVYDHIFLCEPLGHFEKDGLRYQDYDEALQIHHMMESFLTLLKVNYISLPDVGETPEESIFNRLEIIMDAIGATRHD